MSLPHVFLLFFAAVLGGALNSVAGGGGFICFPALVFTGVPPIPANATNTVALWPGTIASLGAYRREIAVSGSWRMLLPLWAMSFLGSAVGALLLLRTPQLTFMRIVPWLLLGATLLFIFSGRVTRWIGAETSHPHAQRSAAQKVGMVALQLAIAIYIGYFGAGAGILMLALFAMMGMENIHEMNGFKSLMAATANGVAVVTFMIAGAVFWPQALLMIAGSVGGGYGGAWYAQKMRPERVRYAVIAIGLAMTVYFFWRVYVEKSSG